MRIVITRAPVMTKSGVETADVAALIAENTENFPVGSRLIPRDCRPHVMAFYLFARCADDVADSVTLSADDKISQLRKVRSALGEDASALPDWALPYHHSLLRSGKTPKYGRDLLTAFIQDATKDRYADWDELMDYCLYSAATVGRVMLDIHGEQEADFEGSDSLCNALQVLNHLQDCKKDYDGLGRVYLPEPWLKSEGGGVEDLSADKASPAVRRVLDRCLDGADALLIRAERMPPTVRRRGLRWESAIILQLARALSAKLRVEDPVAGRVKVSKAGWFWCSTKGIFRAW